VTHAELVRLHGHIWTIETAAGGGWYAVRRQGVSPHMRQHGLRDVLCGLELPELSTLLEQQKRIEGMLRGRIPAQGTA
jgi:hypothetical protein